MRSMQEYLCHHKDSPEGLTYNEFSIPAFCISFTIIIITPCRIAFAAPWNKIQKLIFWKKFAHMIFGTFYWGNGSLLFSFTREVMH